MSFTIDHPVHTTINGKKTRGTTYCRVIFNEGVKLNKDFTMKKVSIWGLVRCKIFVCLGHFMYVGKNKTALNFNLFWKVWKNLRK